jgi:predicted  nucleic acid-binding Zn-ribbon protein
MYKEKRKEAKGYKKDLETLENSSKEMEKQILLLKEKNGNLQESLTKAGGDVTKCKQEIMTLKDKVKEAEDGKKKNLENFKFFIGNVIYLLRTKI